MPIWKLTPIDLEDEEWDRSIYKLRIDTLRDESVILHRLTWFCRPSIPTKIKSACYEMPCKSPTFTQI